MVERESLPSSANLLGSERWIIIGIVENLGRLFSWIHLAIATRDHICQCDVPLLARPFLIAIGSVFVKILLE